MASSGTMRGTPARGQGRGAMPSFTSPGQSSIPRPAFDSHSHPPATPQSDVGAASTMSASRQKQSKRDEVFGFAPHLRIAQ
jgi:hypothetical protein